MSGMAKKKPQKDQHKGRVLVGIPKELHARVKALAEDSSRPLTWELRLLLEEAVERAEAAKAGKAGKEPKA